MKISQKLNFFTAEKRVGFYGRWGGFYGLIEMYYREYLTDSELKNAEYVFYSINLHTLWHAVETLLQSLKTKMLNDGNKVELYIEGKNLIEFWQQWL